MVFVQTDTHERRLKRDPYHNYLNGKFLKSYDEKNQIITTYKEKFVHGIIYFLWRFDFLNNKLHIDSVSEVSPKEFQKRTNLPPTPENIKKYQHKLIKYVPKKEDPLNVLLVYIKWSFSCTPVSYLGYQLRRAIYIAYDMLASMG